MNTPFRPNECTIEIDKENIKFSSGHFTIFSGTERERLHGHNFSVSASFTGKPDGEGMMGDYAILKRILRDLSSSLDEYFLLPSKSPHLKVISRTNESTPEEIRRIYEAVPESLVAVFGEDEYITLPRGDVKVLPVANITVEELSKYLSETMRDKYGDQLRSMGVRAFNLRVRSAPGQGAVTYTCLDTNDMSFGEVERRDNAKRRNPKSDEQGDVEELAEVESAVAKEGVAIVTGGTSGIGLETARSFVRAGYKVYNISRKTCPIEEVISLQCDLSDQKAVSETLSELHRRVKRDLEGIRIPKGNVESDSLPTVCVVHNAALYGGDNACDVERETIEKTLAVQVVTPAVINRELIPLMPYGSSIVFIGSTLSEKGVPRALSYITAKHAECGLMRATSQDLHGRGIHTVLLCPGFTDTPMLRQHLGNNSELLATIASANAYGRLVSPSEIATLVMVAAKSPTLNGSVIHANLGQKES